MERFPGQNTVPSCSLPTRPDVNNQFHAHVETIDNYTKQYHYSISQVSKNIITVAKNRGLQPVTIHLLLNRSDSQAIANFDQSIRISPKMENNHFELVKC